MTTFKTGDPSAFASLPDGQRIRLVGRPDIEYIRTGNTMMEVGVSGGYHVGCMAKYFPAEDEWELIGNDG